MKNYFTKGRWIVGMITEFLNGAITFREAANFALARIKSKPVNFSVNGVRFLEADHIIWSIVADVYFNRVYSPPGMEIQPNDIVVDIGAHCGVFSGYAAQQTRNIVVAYEPDPSNFRNLTKFLSMNGFVNVQCYQSAVGSKTGSGTLYLTKVSSRHFLAGYDQFPEDQLDNSVEIRVLSLDDALSITETIDLLKIDCEGAEMDILLSSNDQTLAKIQKMVIEIHDDVRSHRMRAFHEHINNRFSRVKVEQTPGQSLGYVYAWK